MAPVRIEHPRIYIDATGRTTSALLVDAGRVRAIGDAALSAPADRTLRPDARALFPALADAHVHLWGLGQRPGVVDLSGSRSAREALARVRAAAPGPCGWVIGDRWDDHGWEERSGWERRRLDEAWPEVPALLLRVDHHAALANSAALARARIGPETVIEGGEIGRDARGELSGLVVDEALARVLSAVPAQSEAEIERVYFGNEAKLRGHGIGSAHMAWASVASARALTSLAERGALKLRVHLMLDDDDPGLEERLREGPTRLGAARLNVDTVKHFADGALGSRGALLLGSYRGGGSGLAVTSAAELARRVRSESAAGWRVAVHAIGDGAARATLDAFEAIGPEARRRLRPRLEHAQMMEARDVRRMAELGVIASIQPIHLRSDAVWAHTLLGPAELERLYRWRDIADAGALIAAGSDYPIEDENPWHGVATAIERRAASGEPWRPEQALTRCEILDAYTRGAAWAAGWEDELGALLPGFAADIIALDVDPLRDEPERIWEARADWIEV